MSTNKNYPKNFRISDETLTKLKRIKNLVSAKLGRTLTWDEVINLMIEATIEKFNLKPILIQITHE